ncbi:chalcone isomerase family protein [Variovorax robiniae]|uniref:Chalcone isomerase family protein n=1 Tax=Variovorax robiniae TaxID=1836199 RepID=A0ABU8X9R4_9BURK
MTLRVLRARIGAVCMVLALFASIDASAAPVNKFATTTQVRGTPLILNGSGTRYRAVFKVYDVGMYTTAKVGTPEEVIALAGPKRLNFIALRDLDTTDVGLGFVKTMRMNATPEQMLRHTPEINRLIEIFSTRSKVLAGQSFAMEYVPGIGTTFFIMNEAQGAPVGDAEFFAMVLNIWLGPSPADPLLKDALLSR